MRPTVARTIARLGLEPHERERLSGLRYRDAGHGYDPFGMHPDWVAAGYALLKPLYRHYFRVRSVDVERVPERGPVIVVANHSGTLPFDGAMLWADLVHARLRVPRPVADHFVPGLPLVSELYQRCGVVGGARRNVQALLEAGELLLIFPEGVPGIGKPFSQRYTLQTWRRGHAELAIRHRAAVVPAAVIGAEEQMPQIGRLEGLSLFGIPYVPITLSPVPLPVRYHLYYGDPIPLGALYSREQADDPEVVAEAAERTRAGVEALIARGLRERRGIFR
ncbi:MAG: acyltransferase family protein [Planctomycetota bacterium]|nr:MAG: acyltransferase family protein [Planctomycetota bacterium]